MPFLFRLKRPYYFPSNASEKDMLRIVSEHVRLPSRIDHNTANFLHKVRLYEYLSPSLGVWFSNLDAFPVIDDWSGSADGTREGHSISCLLCWHRLGQSICKADQAEIYTCIYNNAVGWPFFLENNTFLEKSSECGSVSGAGRIADWEQASSQEKVSTKEGMTVKMTIFLRIMAFLFP